MLYVCRSRTTDMVSSKSQPPAALSVKTIRVEA